MLKIKNVENITMWFIDLGEHGKWDCKKVIEFESSYAPITRHYYRFEYENPNTAQPLCIYLNRERDFGGFYHFENNMITAEDYVVIDDIKDMDKFKEILTTYSIKVFDLFKKSK